MTNTFVDTLIKQAEALQRGEGTIAQLRQLRENLDQLAAPADMKRLADALRVSVEAKGEKLIREIVEQKLNDLELRILRGAVPQGPVAKVAAQIVEPVEKFVGGQWKGFQETTQKIASAAETTAGGFGRVTAAVLGSLGIAWLASKIVRKVSGEPQSWLSKTLHFCGLSALAFFIYNRLGPSIASTTAGAFEGAVHGAEKKPESKKVDEKKEDQPDKKTEGAKVPDKKVGEKAGEKKGVEKKN